MSDDPSPWPLWTTEQEAPPPGLFEWRPDAPPPPVREPLIPDAATVKIRPARRPTCLECGGLTDADGYCQSCGAKVPTPREHFEAAPTDWVGGVCDRGRVHDRNEDAMSLWAAPDPLREAVLVVCDGVTTSTNSDVAALAAAEAAQAALSGSRPEGLGTPESRAAAIQQGLAEAAVAANEAVLANTVEGDNPASCTFAAVVIRDGEIHHANLGDSRIYWFGETQRVQLSTDHSGAEELISTGMPRLEAETSAQAHAITRWLGQDAPDLTPAMGSFRPTEPGWVMVCSDGLWNYASEPADLATRLGAALDGLTEPRAVAQRLVAWANEQGGRDNITVALARMTDTLQDKPAAHQEG